MKYKYTMTKKTTMFMPLLFLRIYNSQFQAAFKYFNLDTDQHLVI